MKAIAAVDENYGIGKDGGLIIKNKADMKFFKETTMGYPVIMGRKTFESIGKPLPGRTNIVISRQNIQIPGVKTVTGWEALTDLDAFVIGGAQIYKLFLPYYDEIYLTENKGVYEADAFFPTFNPNLYRREELVKEDTFTIVKYIRNL